ncbi:YfhO family protein [Clostridium cylindrosporum]|uniref:Bacterial membrane protein YfhO n=1 Tax=Clostridium cylindrosporum DSM 605 TaxID=1121307 RepID=A0A0J8D8J8_CLOCY|nr:YfhO family protein [Clostridium cylindrosporum]KMT22202.1 bacterial membrane protein YfhO [Clostridium cylindrosporum DSM 605]
MKKFLRDIVISFTIACLSFYVIYLINGQVLYNDLYAQGLPFLEYFKNQFNIGDLIYNWNMGLGDSSYAFIIYYLLSPFNLLLLLFRKTDMVDLLPIFMTIKITFIVYFASLYFKKVCTEKYKWIGAIIYLSSYNIIMYGSIHVMWLDTFAFLPLVLLGIEKVLRGKGKKLYIISLFFLIITNYYLAALLVIHIALYGIIRYMVLEGKRGLVKFVSSMIGYSTVSGLLAGFVLIPAIGYMLTSSKDVSAHQDFTNSISRLLEVFLGNHIGAEYSLSSTYITLIGMLCVPVFIIFNKVKRECLYLIPIGLLLLAVFSDSVNYIFNLGYEACGGNYRYNILLNIYIGIIICNGLKSLVRGSVKLIISISILSISYIVMLLVRPEFLSMSREVAIINIGFILVYLSLIVIFSLSDRSFKILKKVNLENIVLSLLAILMAFEVFSYGFYINQNRDFKSNDYAKDIKSIVKYAGEKYGKKGRIEINDSGGVYNTYLSQGVEGVEGFHSLMKWGYREAGEVFTDTAYMKVINRLGGRNIITRFTGEKYFISPYNYCPYIGSKLVEKYKNYYIFSVPNQEIKFFDKVGSTLPASMIEKDAVLYNSASIEYSPQNMKVFNEEDLIMDVSNTLKVLKNLHSYPLNNKEIEIKDDGEYYLKLNTSPPNEYTPFNISMTINDVKLGDRSHFSKYIDYSKRKSEIYIGYLKSGDKLKLDFNLGNNPKLVKIDKNYIESSTKNMNSIKKQSLQRGKNSLKASFELSQRGIVVFPVIYDSSWKIKSNGKAIKPIVVNEGFVAFNLDKGSYNIEMRYIPYSIYLGFTLSVITLLCIIISKHIRK